MVGGVLFIKVSGVVVSDETITIIIRYVVLAMAQAVGPIGCSLRY